MIYFVCETFPAVTLIPLAYKAPATILNLYIKKIILMGFEFWYVWLKIASLQCFVENAPY